MTNTNPASITGNDSSRYQPNLSVIIQPLDTIPVIPHAMVENQNPPPDGKARNPRAAKTGTRHASDMPTIPSVLTVGKDFKDLPSESSKAIACELVTTPAVEPISEQERKELDSYEIEMRLKWDACVKIRQNLAKFVEEQKQEEWEAFVRVGDLLRKIKERRLYREDYPTFEDYCRTKWHYGKVYAYRLIHAAEIVKYLLPIGNSLPQGESQVRPLYGQGLSEEQQRTVWRRLVEIAAGQQPTAKQVKQAIAEFLPPKTVRKKSSHLKRTKQSAAEPLTPKALLETVLNLKFFMKNGNQLGNTMPLVLLLEERLKKMQSMVRE